MLYVPIATDKAAQLSAAIYQLSRPPAIRDTRDGTSFFCTWLPHPTRPEVASLQLPENATIPIHAAGDGQLLAETLAPFVGNELTNEEAAGLSAAIQQMAGQTVMVTNLIPPSWQPYIMDQATAENLGWIPSRPNMEQH